MWNTFKRLLRFVHTKHYNVTLTGGTFDENCDGQNGLRTSVPINVAFDGDVDVTGSFGVHKALQTAHTRTVSKAHTVVRLVPQYNVLGVLSTLTCSDSGTHVSLSAKHCSFLCSVLDILAE